MLDMLSKYQESVADDFIEHSKTTPAWLFLKWIS
jgi:DNA-dependent protein kinase catalytic subunit